MPPCSTPYLVIKHRHGMASHPAGPGLGGHCRHRGQEAPAHPWGTWSSRAGIRGAVDPMVTSGWYPDVGTGGMSVAGGKRLPRTLQEHG